MRILAVDDAPLNLLVLRRVLEGAGYLQVDTTTEPAKAVQLFVETARALVLLDLHMPGMDGIELMRQLIPLAGDCGAIPFLVLTADDSVEAKRRAVLAGARDFITKPFEPGELLLRVRNLLQVQMLQRRLRERNADLEAQVAERTRDLKQARLETLRRLVLAAEYRDDDTREHAWRIGLSSARLAEVIGLADWQVELLESAAPLHDIGKIGIPDVILLKPGKLTEAEFACARRIPRSARRSCRTARAWCCDSPSGSPATITSAGTATATRSACAGRRSRSRRGSLRLATSSTCSRTNGRTSTPSRSIGRWPRSPTRAGRQFDPELVAAFTTLDHPALANPERRAVDNRPAISEGARAKLATLS